MEIIELNRFSSNVGTNLAEQVPQSNLELNYEAKPNMPFLVIQPTTIETVTKLLLMISDSKAMSDDKIPVRFLKMCIDTVAPIICHIINISIVTKIVLHRWKTAIITPLYEEGDRGCTSNY